MDTETIEKRSESFRRKREQRAAELKTLKRVYRTDELIAMGRVGSRASLDRANKAGRLAELGLRRVPVGLQGVGYVIIDDEEVAS